MKEQALVQSKLSDDELNYLRSKFETNGERSIEVVMSLYYKKPCRRVFPYSNDPVVTKLQARRGSVIVSNDEVVVVCNPLDFHLLSPINHAFKFQKCDPTDEFLSGTTIITNNPNSNYKVTYFLNRDHGSRKNKEKGYPWLRWGHIFLFDEPIDPRWTEIRTKSSYPISGGCTKVVTCAEEVEIIAKNAAAELKRFRESLHHDRKIVS